MSSVVQVAAARHAARLGGGGARVVWPLALFALVPGDHFKANPAAARRTDEIDDLSSLQL